MSDRESNPNPNWNGSEDIADLPAGNSHIEYENHRRAAIIDAAHQHGRKNELDDLIAPYREELTQEFGSVANGIKQIFGGAKAVKADPASFVAYVAKAHGLTYDQLSRARPAEETYRMLTEGPQEEAIQRTMGMLDQLGIDPNELSEKDFGKYAQQVAQLRRAGKGEAEAIQIAWQHTKHVTRKEKGADRPEAREHDRRAAIKGAMRALGFKGRK